MSLDVLVVTVVHTPLDARIHRREVRALLDAGHRVVLAAPFTGHGVDAAAVDPRLGVVDLPRAQGRSRGRALVAAYRLLRRAEADVVIVHDPELLLAVAASGRRPVVWDVHEDLASSFDDKPWLPARTVPVLTRVVAWAERWAERRCTLLLAEEGYRGRFSGDHPVVPNLPPLPPTPRGPVDDRAVYVGRVSRLRGAEELVTVGAGLRAEGIGLDVVGPVDADVAELLQAAHDRGDLVHHGFLPNDRALAVLDGALAGLSLLHDHPNYRHSLPTKVVEYQAAGVPVVTTPLPAAVRVVESAGSGVVVPFGRPDAVVEAVVELREDRARAHALSAAGRHDAANGRSWEAAAPHFVRTIADAASAP